MKFTMRVMVFFVILFAFLIRSCGQAKKDSSSAATTNPLSNPSFEICNDDTEADFWTSSLSSSGTINLVCHAKRTKTTSTLMPTEGTYYMELRADNCNAGVYQDSISLSNFSTLKFDWQASGTIGTKAARARLLFSDTSTQTLWTKNFETRGTVAEQSTDETVTLSGLPTSGKFSLEVDSTSTFTSTDTSTSSSSNNIQTVSSFTFRVDNFRVCDSNNTCYGNTLTGTSCGTGTSSSSNSSSSSSSSSSSTTKYCSTGYCYSYTEGVCCARSVPYACKGLCYASTSAAMSAGACTTFKTTCY